jgi:ATP/maltotriose-dependent transcriptional regulator MalT
MSERAMSYSESIQLQPVCNTSYIIQRNISTSLRDKLATSAQLATLVAPAGAGKTQVAKQLVNLFKQGGNEAHYLDSTVIPLQEKAWTRLLASVLLGTESGVEDIESLAIRYQQQATSQKPQLVVIDNADALRGTSIWTTIKRFIKRSLHSCRFVLVSRYDLADEFATQKAEGSIAEVNFNDLALSGSEAKLIAERMGVLDNYSASEMSGFLDLLLAKSHGWPAGVVIALRAILNGGDPQEFLKNFCGKDRDVVSYFRENVMESIADDCADLLLECSLGKKIDDRYINHVMGRCDTTRIKELIATENAFVIECDRNRDTLALHPLFREFLEYEFSFRDQQRCLEFKKKTAEIADELSVKTHEVVYADFGGMVEKLTGRETQLVELISSGFTNREIGEKLFISEKTVKWHLHKIYAKMGVKNRTTAVAKARSCQMIN